MRLGATSIIGLKLLREQLHDLSSACHMSDQLPIRCLRSLATTVANFATRAYRNRSETHCGMRLANMHFSASHILQAADDGGSCA